MMPKLAKDKVSFFRVRRKGINIPEKVNKILPIDNKPETKKKRIELYFLLTFLSLKDAPRKYKIISKDERPDFVVQDMETRQKMGVEIFRVLDSNEAYHKLNEEVCDILDNKMRSSISVLQENTNESVRLLATKAKEKSEKLHEASWRKFDYNILLIVTTESRCNPEVITGHWYERSLSFNKLSKISHLYDQIYILNYNSSGKDGGPTLQSIKGAAKILQILKTG